MDSQQSREIKGSNTFPNKHNESRFSRRKVIQSGLAVSPLLFTVKSPTVWGADLNACNISTLISGNVSQQNDCGGKTINPESPGYWHQVFHATKQKKGKGNKYKIRRVLANNYQVYDYTAFSALTNLGTLLSSISTTLGSKWTVTLSGVSQDPAMSTVFPDGGVTNDFSLILNFYSTETGNVSVDLTGGTTGGSGVSNFHRHTASGCLNGLFSGIITSYFTYAQVIQLLHDALLDVCVSITGSLNNTPATPIDYAYISTRLGENNGGFLKDIIAW
ncbi:hypothetical protein [Vibrio sp. HN007]|uniref:hypothetical protein n=1 Tax=Vibrio iocasae TaxID=3098914 RepID=UPI0035D45455